MMSHMTCPGKGLVSIYFNGRELNGSEFLHGRFSARLELTCGRVIWFVIVSTVFLDSEQRDWKKDRSVQMFFDSNGIASLSIIIPPSSQPACNHPAVPLPSSLVYYADIIAEPRPP